MLFLLLTDIFGNEVSYFFVKNEILSFAWVALMEKTKTTSILISKV